MLYGEVRTHAKLSQMVSSWWKSLLLTPVDPFFAKHGAGVEVPVKVTGVNGDPKFGLDFGHNDDGGKPVRGALVDCTTKTGASHLGCKIWLF